MYYWPYNRYDLWNIWYMIYDIWYMIYDIWYMIYDISRSSPGWSEQCCIKDDTVRFNGPRRLWPDLFFQLRKWRDSKKFQQNMGMKIWNWGPNLRKWQIFDQYMILNHQLLLFPDILSDPPALRQLHNAKGFTAMIQSAQSWLKITKTVTIATIIIIIIIIIFHDEKMIGYITKDDNHTHNITITIIIFIIMVIMLVHWWSSATMIIIGRNGQSLVIITLFTLLLRYQL